MKPNSIVKTTVLALITAVAVIGAAGHLTGQEKGSAKGGAAQLTSKPIRTLADLSAVQPGDMMVMSCPKCKNFSVSYVEPSFKAVEPKEKVKAHHTCPGCNTTIAVEGHGKAKRDVGKHVCMACGSKEASCCVMKKGGEPTKGMEKK